jgi:Protein DA1
VSCTGCARLRRPRSDDIAEIGDGRVICLECLHTIVPDTAAAQPLYNEVVEFYRTNLAMQIPEVPPLMLVENSGLNEACDREGRSGHIDGSQQGPATHTRGLCLIERVTSVRTGRIARDRSGSLTSTSEMVPLQVDSNTVVVAILVLAGLPRVVTGAVIAHELMHAWLREHGIRKLSEQVEEGLCQLMSYLWLEAQQLEVLALFPHCSVRHQMYSTSLVGM